MVVVGGFLTNTVNLDKTFEIVCLDLECHWEPLKANHATSQTFAISVPGTNLSLKTC